MYCARASYDSSVFDGVIVLRLLVKLKMHKLVFVYVIVIIIIINDRYFAIWFIEHKLGWLQQCRAHSKQLTVQYRYHLSINVEIQVI